MLKADRTEYPKLLLGSHLNTTKIFPKQTYGSSLWVSLLVSDFFIS